MHETMYSRTDWQVRPRTPPGTKQWSIGEHGICTEEEFGGGVVLLEVLLGPHLLGILVHKTPGFGLLQVFVHETMYSRTAWQVRPSIFPSYDSILGDI